jgi:polysaccharide biosynthesis protein PslE
MIIEPTAHAVLSVLFRRKRVVIATTLFVASVGAAYLLLVTPKYKSEAAVVVRFDQQSVPTTDMSRESTPEVTAANDRREIIEAHQDILTNPDLARAVIESVGLNVAYPGIAEDPPWHGTPMDAAIFAFEKNLLVDPEIAGDVINIGLMHPNPKLAQVMLTKLIDLYMKQEGQLFSSSDFSFQRDEADQAAKRLAAAQIELRDYKAHWNISSFSDQISDLIQQRSDLSAGLQSNAVSLEQASQKRDELTRLLATVPKSVSNSASGEKYHSYDDALSNLAALQQKEKEMMVTYRADSPMLAQLHAQIESGEADVARRRADISRRDDSTPNIVYQNIQTDLLRASADVQSFSHSVAVQKAQLAAMDKEISDLEAARTGLDDRTRAVQVADGAYRSLALHLEDTRVAESKLKSGISHGAILTAPTLPYEIAKPRYMIMSVAFVVASILAGLGVAIGLEFMDDRFTSAGQLVHTLQVPVLATFEEPT